MRMKFETLFRGFLIFLTFTAAWTIWAAAQAPTNAPTAAATNQPIRLVESVERFSAHPLSFGLDRIAPLREMTFLGEPAWKYVASLLYILLALLAAKLIDLITNVWLKRLAARTQTELDDLLLDLLRGPIKVVVFVVLLHIGLNLFDWSAPAKLYFSRSLILIVAASITYVTIKVVGLMLDLWHRRLAQESERRFNDQLLSIIRKSFTAFILVVAVLVTAQNMGVNITAVITSLSIGGLAVGLAAQDTLGNLFGAVAIFTDKPFRVGDHIKLDATEGHVESVGLRSTRLRNLDGHLVAVPNKTMGNAIITNISQRPSSKTVTNLVLARSVPPAKIKQALEILGSVYRGSPLTDEVWINFNQLNNGNSNIVIIHWCKRSSYKEYLAAMQEINFAVKERFETEGIVFT
jgi:MscS family membrane protein